MAFLHCTGTGSPSPAPLYEVGVTSQPHRGGKPQAEGSHPSFCSGSGRETDLPLLTPRFKN